MGGGASHEDVEKDSNKTQKELNDKTAKTASGFFDVAKVSATFDQLMKDRRDLSVTQTKNSTDILKLATDDEAKAWSDFGSGFNNKILRVNGIAEDLLVGGAGFGDRNQRFDNYRQHQIKRSKFNDWVETNATQVSLGEIKQGFYNTKIKTYIPDALKVADPLPGISDNPFGDPQTFTNIF